MVIIAFLNIGFAGGEIRIFTKDYVFHQYHNKCDPPLNYFDSIIENARLFQLKWNALPIRRWLCDSEEMHLIKVDHFGEIIIIRRSSVNR
jgi:hypothetical protein